MITEVKLIELKVSFEEDVGSGQHGEVLGRGGQAMVHMGQWNGKTVGGSISFSEPKIIIRWL